MRSGLLNQRVSLLVKQVTKGRLNQVQEDLILSSRIWAELVERSAQRVTYADGEETETVLKMRIRPRDGVQVGTMIRYGGEVFEIEEMTPHPDGKSTEFTAVSRCS